MQNCLFYFQKAKDFQIGPKDVKERKTVHVFLGNLIWLISAARNIIVVVVSAVLAYTFEAHGSHPFILTGYVKPGLPTFSPPPFSTTVGNTTHSFIDMTSAMGTALLVVPLLSILENVALAKVFCK